MQLAESAQPVTAFQLAWFARIFRAANRIEDYARLLEQLATAQLPDGSWESSALLRVPLPDDQAPDRYSQWVMDGRKEGSLALDQQRVFTTATVLACTP